MSLTKAHPHNEPESVFGDADGVGNPRRPGHPAVTAF